MAGPIKPQSWGGAKYSFVLCEDFSRKSSVILLKQKSEVEAKIKEGKAVVKTKSGEKVGKLRTDNAGKSPARA